MLTRLIPKVFYADLATGLDLFVEGLAFRVVHRDASLTVLERDGVKLFLSEDAACAAGDRPELSVETDTIDALHAEVAGRRPDLLHPNLAVVTARPWGAREFAVRDKTGVCVVLRQW